LLSSDNFSSTSYINASQLYRDMRNNTLTSAITIKI